MTNNLPNIELFRCERLSASITRKQCEINQARGKSKLHFMGQMFSCQGCPGLGAAVSLSALPKPSATPAVLLRFTEPEDVILYQQLTSLSADLENDIISMLHLLADKRLALTSRPAGAHSDNRARVLPASPVSRRNKKPSNRPKGKL